MIHLEPELQEALQLFEKIEVDLRSLEGEIDKAADAQNGYVQQQTNATAQAINSLCQIVVKLIQRIVALENDVSMKYGNP